MRTRTLALAAVSAVAAAAPAAASPAEPTLVGRALLPADATAPAPFPGAANTEPAPAPGATQPIGGFSALVDAPGRDTFYAMPDNGFGNTNFGSRGRNPSRPDDSDFIEVDVPALRGR